MQCSTVTGFGCYDNQCQGSYLNSEQRPLKTIAIKSGDVYIPRGVSVPALDKDILWEFQPKKLGGDLYATWPVCTPRPVAEKLAADTPLLTGQYSNTDTGCGERGNEMAEVFLNRHRVLTVEVDDSWREIRSTTITGHIDAEREDNDPNPDPTKSMIEIWTLQIRSMEEEEWEKQTVLLPLEESEVIGRATSMRFSSNSMGDIVILLRSKTIMSPLILIYSFRSDVWRRIEICVGDSEYSSHLSDMEGVVQVDDEIAASFLE
nr:V-type proton ATPase catalytic subunit A [Ipomoea batatas]